MAAVTDVLIVGGGPAGLAAALAARRRGLEVEVVESGRSLGGMAASFTIDGIRVDHGSHRLHPVAPPRVRCLLDEVLGSDLQLRERNGRLRLDDRWVGFPLRAGDLARSLPPSFAARAARDQATRPLRRATADSYAELVRVGLGPTALEAFHRPMATKLWGVDPSHLAGELARRRVPVRSPGGLASRVLRGSRSNGRTFLYPRNGFGQIVDRLADASTEAGAEIRTATTVSAIDPGPDGPTVRVGRSGPRRVGRVLWTAPTEALVGVVDGNPGVPPLPHRGLVLAYLGLANDRWTTYDAHYVPDLDVAFSRLSEPRNYRAGDDPPGRTVLCAELPCTVGDEIWLADPASVSARVLDGMARCGLAIPAVDGVVLRHLPSVYPVLTVADAGHRQSILDWADAIPGVTVLGRQGRGTADNIHHVIDMALTAIDQIGSGGRWHGRGWAEATDRFERFIVED